MSIFFTFGELHFSGLESIRFYPTFWQKPWTNPFAKCRLFSSLWELHFWGPKSIIFYPQYQRMFLSGFFCLKKKTDKNKVYYWQKPWTNNFAKCQYFLTLLELHFSGLKSIVFYPEYQKMFLSGFFCLKKTYEKKVDFCTKARRSKNVSF